MYVIHVVLLSIKYYCSYTPLMEAAREGHEDVVQLLVEHGANVNTQTEETQETALTLACCGGFMEVVQYLIEHGQSLVHIHHVCITRDMQGIIWGEPELTMVYALLWDVLP